MKKIMFLLFLVSVSFSFATTIYDIQYTTTPGPDNYFPSPLEGQVVTVTGIVTGENYNDDNKFFMSDTLGGAWHGIYVYDYNVGPALGDEVEVTGTVSEYYGLTELGNCTITILSSGNAVPDPLPVTTADLTDPTTAEQYEGCLVSVSNVSVTEEQNDYGEWFVDDGSGECQIDDGFFYLDSVTPPIVITIGMEWDMIIGCVDFSYDEYGINPRTPDDLINDATTLLAEFSATPLTGTVPLEVTFTDESTGTITSWEWDFDNDGTIDSNDQNPVYTYNDVGIYSVSLTVSDGTVDDTELKIDYISANNSASLTIYDIQYTTTPGPDNYFPSLYEGQIVTTTGIVSGENYNDDNKFFMSDTLGGAWHGIYVYDYEIGPVLGDEVEITGTVSEYYGYTELTDCTITVLSSGNTVPDPLPVTTADLTDPATAEQYEGCLVSVSNVSVTEEQNDYGEWFVDDGSGECQIDDGFFYLDSVTPPIVITIGMEWDMIIGCVDFSYDEYGINPRTPDDLISDTTIIEAEFSATPLTGVVPLEVIFTDESTGTITSWEWDFDNDGSIDSTNQNPIYEYTEAGIYTVSLTVSDGTNSDTETKIEYIEVISGMGAVSGTVYGLDTGGPLQNCLVTLMPYQTSTSADGTFYLELPLDSYQATFAHPDYHVYDYPDTITVLPNQIIELEIFLNPLVGINNNLNVYFNELDQNYPNPFNPTTEISFQITEGENGVLKIYNVNGQLVLSQNYGSGIHNFKWNAEMQSSGIYFYKLKTDSYSKTKKMILLK